MAEQYLHGVQVLEITDGTRPVRTLNSSIIGIVGTAPFADASVFPLNTPVLVTSITTAAKLDNGSTPETVDRGTLPSALKDIYDEVGAAVVVVRVDVGADDAETISNIVGDVDANGDFSGIVALEAATTICQVQPRIIIAPHYSAEAAVSAQLQTTADKLKAVCPVDCPNTTEAEAITYRNTFASRRVLCCYPYYKAWDTLQDAEVSRPLSTLVAADMVWTDYHLGFWHSMSNKKPIGNITGLSKTIEYRSGDTTCTANRLNENEIVTVKAKDGYKIWGSRTCSDDAKFAFINVVRTNDMINDSIQAAHDWAVDRNIIKTYFEDVSGSVNNYLRHLKNIGAILGGECWVDQELNSADQQQAGSVYFDYDFTVPGVAEKITFRSHLVTDYFSNVFE